jgi:hypothetical protein
MKLSRFGEKWKFFSALLICLSLYLLHFTSLLKNSVNIPFWDEWEAITPGGLLAEPSLAQILLLQNEHRIVTTKVLTLLLYEIDGWNLVTHQALNFIIYDFIVGALVYLVKKSVPQLPGWIILIFAVFLLTLRNIESHFMGWQTSYHCSLLFFFLGIWFLFDEKQSWLKILVGVFFSWLAIYSLLGGLIESAVALFGYSLFKFFRIRDNDKRRREILQLLFVWLAIGGAIGLYFVDYVKPGYHPQYTLPFEPKFWAYFLNLLSGGFGYISLNLLPGFLIFIFLIVPIIGVILKRGRSVPPNAWIIIVSILAVAACLASISMGRAGFGAEQAKASRYSELVTVLIPLSVGMWAVFLDNRERLRNFVLLAFWLFCFVGFFKFWNFPKGYRLFAEDRRLGFQCVKDYYHRGNDGNCPTIYPAPIADRLELAKTLKLSFSEEATAENDKK